MILNTFYDEYRFILSFKDRRNLISFAKLFGGIINKSIIEDTLMEISIKFIIQALQNDDNRLTFGIEALKRSYQCLSDFPRQFEEIYTMFSGKIKEKDPDFHKKFV
jgi:predicted solute-binding protein